MGKTLWPKGVKGVEDVPNDFITAVDHAFKVLGWREFLLPHEMPPHWMWHLDWELDTWFAEVDRQRKNPEPEGAEVQPGQYDENELLAGMK